LNIISNKNQNKHTLPISIRLAIGFSAGAIIGIFAKTWQCGFLLEQVLEGQFVLV
jgi:hypothetical protein